jgi:hypothetical protein
MGGGEVIDSNHTLRFNRTSREAYGHFIEFEHAHHRLEAWIYISAIFAIGVLCGVLLSA